MELLINKNATRSGTIYDMNPRDVTPSVIIVEGASYPITPPLIADSLLVGTAGEDDKMLNSAHGTKGVPYESPIGGIALPPLGPIGAIALPKGAPMGVTEKYVLHSPPGYDTPTHHGLSLGVTVRSPSGSATPTHHGLTSLVSTGDLPIVSNTTGDTTGDVRLFYHLLSDCVTPAEIRTFLLQELCTFLDRYLNADQVQMVLAIGGTELKHMQHLTRDMLPPDFPALKVSCIVHDSIALVQGAVPHPAPAVVQPSAPAVVQSSVDKPKYWSKAYEQALRVARECPPLPKDGVFDPTTVGWTLFLQSLSSIFEYLEDPTQPLAPGIIQELMLAISLNPIPALDSYAKAQVVMNTDPDKLLFRVLMKLLPEAFLQRVNGTSIITSKSGITLYHYLCNTSPSDRSQRIQSLRKTLYQPGGCKDPGKLASVLQQWWAMYKEVKDDVATDAVDKTQLLTALKVMVAPQMDGTWEGLTLAHHLSTEASAVRRTLKLESKPVRDLTLEEYYGVCLEFGMGLQSATTHNKQVKAFYALLEDVDPDDAITSNLATGKVKGGKGGKGKGGKGQAGTARGSNLGIITLGDKTICSQHVLGYMTCHEKGQCASLDHSPGYKGKLTQAMLAKDAWTLCKNFKEDKCNFGNSCKFKHGDGADQLQFQQLLKQTKHLPKANQAQLTPPAEEDALLVSHVAKIKSNMSTLVTTEQTQLLDNLHRAHAANTLHIMSPIEAGVIISPVTDSGGSHHFVCTQDAVKSGTNWQCLRRPLNVETANGLTKVEFTCNIPTALGLLTCFYLPGALYSLASVTKLATQFGVTYNHGTTEQGANLVHQDSNTFMTLREDGGLYFLPTRYKPFPARLQANTVRIKEPYQSTADTGSPCLGSHCGQADSNGSQDPWMAPQSYVFGEHDASVIAQWSLITLQQVITGAMAATVRDRGGIFEDVSDETLNLACQSWYDRYYQHQDYTSKEHAKDAAGQQGVIDEFLRLRSNNIPRTSGPYRYCAVPAPWPSPDTEDTEDTEEPWVYYICFECLQPYDAGGRNNTCDSCIAAGLQRKENQTPPAYLPDVVDYNGHLWRRFGSKLGRMSTKHGLHGTSSKRQRTCDTLTSPCFVHPNPYAPLADEADMTKDAAVIAMLDFDDAFVQSDPYEPSAHSSQVCPQVPHSLAAPTHQQADSSGLNHLAIKRAKRAANASLDLHFLDGESRKSISFIAMAVE